MSTHALPFIRSLIPLILVIPLIFMSGCSNYAEPKIVMNTDARMVSSDDTSRTISYNISLNIANTGDNNAYNVKVLVITGTPQDQPEYRFINKNFEVGTIEKGKNITINQQMDLQMTDTNYQLLKSGHKPFVDAQVTQMTSNVMG